MIVHKITDIANETSVLLNKDPTLVASIVQHTLASIKSYLENPNKAGIRVENLGVIRPYQASLTRYLKRLISKLRNPDLTPTETQTLQNTFRIFWKLRKLQQQDNERRNFKKRFGS